MRFARCSYYCLRLPLFSFQRSMQSEPNFKLLTPFWSECQQQNLSKNLLWVAGCLSNKLTLICQGVFKLASNAALLCKSLAFVCEIKIIVKAPNKYFFQSLFNRLNDGSGLLYTTFIKEDRAPREKYIRQCPAG